MSGITEWQMLLQFGMAGAVVFTVILFLKFLSTERTSSDLERAEFRKIMSNHLNDAANAIKESARITGDATRESARIMAEAVKTIKP